MRANRGSGLLTGLLALACVAAGALVGLGWMATSSPEPIDAASVKPAALPEQQPVDLSILEASPFAAHTETVDRTLFRVERRPQVDEAPEVVVETQKPPADPPPYKLLGVVITPSKRLALLQPLQGGDVQRIPVGGHLDSWKVASIEASKVMFASGKRTEQLEIDRTPGPVMRKAKKPNAKAGKDRDGKKTAKGNRASKLEQALEKKRAKNREARNKRRRDNARANPLIPTAEQLKR